MAVEDNFLTGELRAYYSEQRKSLPETLTDVLNKNLAELTDAERETYTNVVLPARERIKQALAERWEKAGASKDEWLIKTQEYSQSIIGQIACEMLSEIEAAPSQAQRQIASRNLCPSI